MKKNIFRVLSFIMIFAMVVGMVNIGGVQKVNAAVNVADDMTLFFTLLSNTDISDRVAVVKLISNETSAPYTFNANITPSDKVTPIAAIMGLTNQTDLDMILNALTYMKSHYSTHSTYINYGLNKMTEQLQSFAGVTLETSSNGLVAQIVEKFGTYNLFLNFLVDVKGKLGNNPIFYDNNNRLELTSEMQLLIDIAEGLTFSNGGRFDTYASMLESYFNDVNNWSNANERTAFISDLKDIGVCVNKPVVVPATGGTTAPATPIAVGTVKTEKNAAGGTVSTVAVDIKAVEKLITETKTNNVSLDLTSVKGSAEVKIELTSAILNKVIDSKMGIEIKGENATIVLPQEIAKQIGQASGTEKVTINVNVVPAAPAAPASMKVVAPVLDFSIKAGDKQISNFDKNVKAELKVDMSQISDYRKVVASYYNETTKQWEAVNGYLNKLTGVLSFYTNHFSKYTAVENKRAFSDVSTPWAKESIEVLAARNIMNGNSTSTFAPKANITRAEVAAIITRSLNLDTAAVTGKFSDVPSSKWYAKEVEAAANAGIITGIGNSKFAPEDEITREQIAVMISRALEYKQGKAATIPAATFTDAAKISSYAKNAVAVVASKGIVKGSENKFNPANKATREEVAVMLYRLLGILGQM